MKQLKAAIIGCGSISSVHADSIRKSGKAELAAVCDIDTQRMDMAVQKYHTKGYENYKDVLSDQSIDVVHICTPHYLHSQIALEALKAGKHVLTEKPMAISTGAAGEMIDISNKTGKRLGVCFQNRYNTTSVKIKELLKSGKAGRIIGGKAFVTWFRTDKYYTESGWRGTWEKEGGGVLINQSIHTLDLLQWFMGDVESIKANVDTRKLKDVIEVEDTADVYIKFKNNATALFYATNCYVQNSPVEIEIVCENAVLKLCQDLEIKYKDGTVEKVADVDRLTGEKAYWGSGHSALIDDFYSKIISGEDFPIDGCEGIKTIKIIEAIYKSSRNREFVFL